MLVCQIQSIPFADTDFKNLEGKKTKANENQTILLNWIWKRGFQDEFAWGVTFSKGTLEDRGFYF